MFTLGDCTPGNWVLYLQQEGGESLRNGLAGSSSEVARKAGNAPGKGWNGLLEVERAEGDGVMMWQAVKSRGLHVVSCYTHLHIPHLLAQLYCWKAKLLSFWMSMGNMRLFSAPLKGEIPHTTGYEMVSCLSEVPIKCRLWPNNTVSFSCEGSATPVLSGLFPPLPGFVPLAASWGGGNHKARWPWRPFQGTDPWPQLH